MTSPAASPSAATPGCWGPLRRGSPPQSPSPGSCPGRKEGGKVLLVLLRWRRKGQRQPRAGQVLPLPPGKGCKSQEATMGWSWPRGYFYRCPLPFPRAQRSHRDNPGPLHAQLQPGGLRTWHWSRGGRTGCPPCWAPRPSERGQRKPPELPREPPAPCTPLAASLDGELGPRLITETEEAPAGTKAQSSAPEPGGEGTCPGSPVPTPVPS